MHLNCSNTRNNWPYSHFGAFSNKCTKGKKSHLKSDTITYLFGFNGHEKDNEVIGLSNYIGFGDNGLDSRIGRRWNVDPKTIKHPNLSPYSFANCNPIIFIDKNGLDYIIYNMEGVEIYRIVTDEVDIRVKVNETAFNAARTQRYLPNNPADYNALLAISFLRIQEQKTKRTDLISEETGKALNITGEVRDGNDLIADVIVNLQVTFDDGSGIIVETFDGVAGGFGNGAPENGEYTVNHFRDRTPGNGDYSAAMNRNGEGYSYDLNPNFETNRDLLRIHPDGNNEGTLGCIGLSGDGANLATFRTQINNYLSNHDSINTTINITNNPNNSGGGTLPNVVE
jgi:hypothetical protein